MYLIIKCLLGIHASDLVKKLQKIKTDHLNLVFIPNFM